MNSLNNYFNNSKQEDSEKILICMIGKEGVNVNPEFFGSNSEDYKKNFSTLHFKFIISPENQTVDPKLLTECFIHHLEELTGYKFYWLGCVHTDTDHNHAHLAINGIDKYDRKVRFPKIMIQISMREILSIIATRMIGERSEEEIKKQMKK